MLPLQLIAASKLKLKAVAFGGTNEYAAVGGNYTEHDKERTDSWSFGCWVRKPVGGGFGVMFGKTNGLVAGANIRGWDTYFDTGADVGKIGFSINHDASSPVGTSNKITKVTNATFNDGRWHFNVCTYSGTSTAAGMKIWVDAVDQATTTQRDNLTGTIKTTNVLTFGAHSSLITFATEDLSHCFIVDYVLSGDEIAEMYADRSPPPYDHFTRFPFLSGHLQGFWLPQLTDTNPTLTDTGSGAHNATMTNMEAADIFSR